MNDSSKHSGKEHDKQQKDIAEQRKNESLGINTGEEQDKQKQAERKMQEDQQKQGKESNALRDKGRGNDSMNKHTESRGDEFTAKIK